MPGIDETLNSGPATTQPDGDEYFQTLLNEFSTPDPEPKAPETTAPTGTSAPEPTPAEPTVEPVVQEPDLSVTAPKDPEPTQPENKQAAAFAELRVKASKYEKLFQAAAEKAGLSIEDYMAKIEADNLAARAQQMNVDPEVMRRLENLEQENQRYRDLQIQTHLQTQYGQIKAQLGVDDKDLQSFTAQLIKNGHNFENMQTDYVTLFRGMNYEKLVEKERQKWITRDTKGQQASAPITQNGRRETTSEKGPESVSELSALLDGLKL